MALLMEDVGAVSYTQLGMLQREERRSNNEFKWCKNAFCGIMVVVPSCMFLLDVHSKKEHNGNGVSACSAATTGFCPITPYSRNLADEDCPSRKKRRRDET